MYATSVSLVAMTMRCHRTVSDELATSKTTEASPPPGRLDTLKILRGSVHKLSFTHPINNKF